MFLHYDYNVDGQMASLRFLHYVHNVDESDANQNGQNGFVRALKTKILNLEFLAVLVLGSSLRVAHSFVAV